ncbi:MAG: glutamine--fructose-6-phosphate transaminase (isomerizing) [Flavobacteriaceae bacterium]|jgi:glucosamine--fructose-6-phosphate aminotransferase (isomerizing)|nr:glutamine--fructose-6-phosphate transaminase (isomerizing) [Flavobacteriaceae bacterium]MDG1968612.1 glutamine--fructose-6-phosphate transaminase (isomerizing) [Flavobacteriaceae bacterium]|tara:strand:- start:255 stop:2102 length:1848 start_codon:yes stop_codon:yes gene_type:complete
MCGIVAYVGKKDPKQFLIEGLRRLEYRGYDSAGILLANASENQTSKIAGKVNALSKILDEKPEISAHIGIGHTRWATHGVPNDLNAHPHHSNSGKLYLVHNGIIENYDAIKQELIQRGYTFYSDTDSEVLVNLIEEIKDQEKVSLAKAVQLALKQVVGAYGIVVFDVTKNSELIVARLGSPLAIGLEEGGFYVGSDATPFLDHTRKVIYLEDNEMAILSKNEKIKIKNIINDQLVDPYIEELEWNLNSIQKGGFDHFMLKEIHEQPKAIKDTLRGRLLVDQGKIQINSINEYKEKFQKANRIIIVACGTSWHAGLVGEYLLEHFVRIPVEVEYASEFRYRDPIIQKNDIVVCISQSGETADTLAALKIAKEKGAFIYGICNVVGSSISRATHSGMYTHAGPEIGVASTKAFSSQITVLILLALKLAELKNTIDPETSKAYQKELSEIPSLIEAVIKNNSTIKTIAEKYADSTNCIYMGRGYNFPVALEGALKLKEISYIHAEGYPAAEMKHGPIALIDKNMPVVVIATKKTNYDKIVSNIQEIKSREGKIIAIVSEGDKTIAKLANDVIEIPDVSEFFTPIIAAIPLQLLSYYIAIIRGCNVDQPRNLAKSVTVE